MQVRVVLRLGCNWHSSADIVLLHNSRQRAEDGSAGSSHGDTIRVVGYGYRIQGCGTQHCTSSELCRDLLRPVPTLLRLALVTTDVPYNKPLISTTLHLSPPHTTKPGRGIILTSRLLLPIPRHRADNRVFAAPDAVLRALGVPPRLRGVVLGLARGVLLLAGLRPGLRAGERAERLFGGAFHGVPLAGGLAVWMWVGVGVLVSGLGGDLGRRGRGRESLLGAVVLAVEGHDEKLARSVYGEVARWGS